MRDAARHVASFAVLAAFLAFNTATSKSHSGSPPIPPPAIDSGVAKKSVDASVPVVKDVDVAAVTKSQCTGKTNDMCRCLADFGKGTTPIDLPATGQDIWAGYTYGTGRLPWFMKIQRGYTPAPDPSLEDEVMDHSAAMQVVRPESAPEADTSSLLSAVKDGKPEPAGNRAGELMHTWSPADWYAMARATSGSIALFTDKSPAHVFVRAAGTRLLVVEWDGGKLLKEGKVEAPLWCAEVWKLK